MSCWLERGESRFLDLITSTVGGLVKENMEGRNPDKYNMFSSGAQVYGRFKKIHPLIIESQIKRFKGISQGRYIRELAYVLLSLDFCVDLQASAISNINIRRFQGGVF